MKTGSGAFGLAMGVLMALVWIVYIAAHQYDVQTAPLEAVSLLAAEAVTALTLILGGIGILAHKAWATVVHITSLGMMLYTAINSIGVFAQISVMSASIFFVILSLVTTALIVAWSRRALQQLQATLGFPGEFQ